MFGEIAALLTACFWTGSSLAFSSATRRAGLFYVNVTRLILALCGLLPLVLIGGGLFRLTGSQVFWLSISGVIGFAIGDTFLFKAYREIGARITMIIMSLSPAMAAGLAYIVLDERLSLTGWAGIGLTLLGILIVVADPGSKETGRHHMTAMGLFCAVMAAAGQGSALVVAKIALSDTSLSGLVATFIRILASLVLLVPFVLITGRYSHPVRVFSSDRHAFRLTIIGAVMGPILGVTCSLLAIQYTEVGIASTIMAIVPILMLPVLYWLYREKLTWRAYAGAVAAVGGVAVLFLR
jgi:drug/metabolite transporter (DMT)-like permease